MQKSKRGRVPHDLFLADLVKIQVKAVRPSQQFILACATAETPSGEPFRAAGQAFQSRGAGTDGAAARGAEGDDGLAAPLIAFQERADNI